MVLFGTGGVEGVKKLLEREKGQTIEIKSRESPELTVLDRDALNRAVSALDAMNHRKGNSLSRSEYNMLNICLFYLYDVVCFELTTAFPVQEDHSSRLQTATYLGRRKPRISQAWM